MYAYVPNPCAACPTGYGFISYGAAKDDKIALGSPLGIALTIGVLAALWWSAKSPKR